jgi:MioC protein
MSSFQIIVGSTLGGTEYVAEACERQLLALEHQAVVHFQPKFSQISQKDQTWLVCIATHGAGDYPENMIEFVKDLADHGKDLSSTKILIIGIGDSNYDTFCLAATKIQNLLLSKGCNEIIGIFTIDMKQDLDPEEVSRSWIEQNRDLL